MAQREPHLEQNRQGFAAHNLAGSFPGMDEAREAIRAVEAAGIDAGLISLIAAGAALGGGIGFLAGLAAFAIPGVGPVLGTGVWAATAGGAVAGGATGGVVGGVSGVNVGDAWELTYQNVREGRVTVGVHADDRAVVDRAAGVLEKAGATGIRRFDAEGRIER